MDLKEKSPLHLKNKTKHQNSTTSHDSPFLMWLKKIEVIEGTTNGRQLCYGRLFFGELGSLCKHF